MRSAAALSVAAVALAGCGGGAPGDSLGDKNQIFLLDRAGGAPQRVTHDSHDYTPPVWSPRGDRLAASFASGIAVFDRAGRRVREFHIAKMNDESSPAWSRDGRRVAFETTYDNPRTGSTDARLVTLAVATGTRRTLADVATNTPAWSTRDRALVYLTGDVAIDRRPIPQAIWTVGADGARPHRIARDAADNFPPQLSRDGTRLLFGREHSVWIARSDGSRQKLVANGLELPDASWAPNGRDVLVVASGPDHDHAFLAMPSRPRRPLPRMIDSFPVAWSPDGRLIAWATTQTGGTLIRAVRPDGSGHRTLARLADRVVVSHLSWSPDSRRLAFSAARSNED